MRSESRRAASAAFGCEETAFEGVDEELTTETLKPGATVEGEAIFASEDDAVYGASLVRLSDRCK